MNRIPLTRANFFALLIAGLAVVWAINNGGTQSRLGSFQVPEIDVPHAKALIDDGALVIDVRGEEAFDNRHIPGSIWIPVETLRLGIPASIAGAKDKAVVVYCGDGVAHGPEGTQILQQAGFSRVANLKPGIEGWAAAGMPIKKGKA